MDEENRHTPPWPTVITMVAALAAQAAESRVAIAKERIFERMKYSR